jgi:hypothetical protein
MAAATGPAATSASCARGAHRCSGSVRRRAGVRWSASGNANDAGKGGMAGIAVLRAGGLARGSRESQEMSLPY